MPLMVRMRTSGEKHSIQPALPPSFSARRPSVNSAIISSTSAESCVVSFMDAMAARASGILSWKMRWRGDSGRRAFVVVGSAPVEPSERESVLQIPTIKITPLGW